MEFIRGHKLACICNIGYNIDSIITRRVGQYAETDKIFSSRCPCRIIKKFMGLKTNAFKAFVKG